MQMIHPGAQGTIETIFNNAIAIEYKAAEIYRKFLQLFSHFQEISAFWRDLAEDEIKHAKTLQAVCKALTHEQLNSLCDRELSDRVASIQRMLSRTMSRPITNLDEAYELAHELEFSEVNAVFKLLSIEMVSSEERKKFVVSEISTHQQKLLDFDRQYGDRRWRKGILSNTL